MFKFRDLLFTPKCVSCGSLGHDLCTPCLLQTKPFLGRSISNCTKVYCASPYSGWVKDVLIEYKNGNKNFGSVIAQLLVRTLDFAKLESSRTVIPIPSSQMKIADRGFDTISQVCRELKRVRPEIQALGSCLTLRHLVQDQVGLSFAERQANMSSAFRATRPVVGDVILIDDVVTTGATLMNAAKALKIAGAKRVYCITLCGTPNSR